LGTNCWKWGNEQRRSNERRKTNPQFHESTVTADPGK